MREENLGLGPNLYHRKQFKSEDNVLFGKFQLTYFRPYSREQRRSDLVKKTRRNLSADRRDLPDRFRDPDARAAFSNRSIIQSTVLDKVHQQSHCLICLILPSLIQSLFSLSSPFSLSRACADGHAGDTADDAAARRKNCPARREI